MVSPVTQYEHVLRQKLVDIITIIHKASKHIDEDFMRSERDRKYSISVSCQDLLDIRKLYKAILENKI